MNWTHASWRTAAVGYRTELQPDEPRNAPGAQRPRRPCQDLPGTQPRDEGASVASTVAIAPLSPSKQPNVDEERPDSDYLSRIPPMPARQLDSIRIPFSGISGSGVDRSRS
jgi:hypothetical protein